MTVAETVFIQLVCLKILINLMRLVEAKITDKNSETMEMDSIQVKVIKVNKIITCIIKAIKNLVLRTYYEARIQTNIHVSKLEDDGHQ